MLELVRLIEATLVAAFRSRRRLVVENLLLRQQDCKPQGGGRRRGLLGIPPAIGAISEVREVVLPLLAVEASYGQYSGEDQRDRGARYRLKEPY